MGREAYEGVLADMRLPSGLAWSVPVTLAVSDDELAGVGRAAEVELVAEDGTFLGVLEVQDRFSTDPVREARLVYGTEEEAHPGVASLYAHGTTSLAGPVRVASRLPIDPAAEARRLDPAASRARFAERGWQTVVGFQTRNPVHRAHEYMQKCALEIVDGLLLHPLVGETKDDDIPADVRMRCYEVLLERLLPDGPGGARACCRRRCATPVRARRSSTRIVRKNYGCTHFIVGRDHAGVGNYYGTYDAQQHLQRVRPATSWASQPLFFEHAFYCTRCGGMATTKTCPHAARGARGAQRHQGARDARPRRGAAGRVHAARGGRDPYRGLLGGGRVGPPLPGGNRRGYNLRPTRMWRNW